MRKAQSIEQTISVDKVDIIAARRKVNVKVLSVEIIREEKLKVRCEM